MVKTAEKKSDLLGVVRPPGKVKRPIARKNSGPRKKYGLNLHLIPQAKSKFKKKRRVVSRWKRFKVQSEDTQISRLGLTQWSKVEKPWLFSKFNIKLTALRYTDSEYQKCNIVHTEWTRRETDTLLDLCSRYELRFHIIQDRFLSLFPPEKGETGRTIPQLKERYYSIQRALLEHRSKLSRKDLSNNIHFKRSYDLAADLIRREQLEKVLSRTKEQHLEMLRLVEANRKNNQALKQKKKEAKERRKKFREQQQFITKRVRAGSTKANCVLATGGLMGYLVGFGVIIKDEWRKESKPAEGSILANLPREAKVVVLPQVKERRVFSRETRIYEPYRMVVLGNENQKELIVQSPAPEDPTGRNGKKKRRKNIVNFPFHAPPGYLLSLELQNRLDALGFPVSSSAGPFKYPTSVLCSMFDKLRQDLLSLLCLEQLVAKKKLVR